jgi:hypothetical protein
VYQDKTYRYGPFTSDKYEEEYHKLHNLPEKHRLTNQQRKNMNLEFYNIYDVLILISIHIEE